MKLDLFLAIFALCMCGCQASKNTIHTSYAEYSNRVEVPPKFFGDNVNECARNEKFSSKWQKELSRNGREKFFLRVVCSAGSYYYIYGTKLVTDRYYVVVTRNNEAAMYVFEYSEA